MDATVKMSVDQWNQVLDILGDATVKRAMSLITAIMNQINQQIQATDGPRQDNTIIPNRNG